MRTFLKPVLLLVAVLLPAAPAHAATAGMLGLGGRLTWIQQAQDDPRTWVDAQILVRPLPRLFLAGSWGWAKESLRGGDADTTLSELRWDLALGVVVLDADVTGYIPLMWRHVGEKNSWNGDANWTELGTGIGVLYPLGTLLQLRSEALWVAPTSAHPELRLGADRSVDGSHLELSLGFLLYVR